MIKTIKIVDELENNKLNNLLKDFKTIFNKYTEHLLNKKYIYKYGSNKSFEVIFKKKDLMHLLGIFSYTKKINKCNVTRFGSLDFYKDLETNSLDISKINIRDAYRAIKLIFKKIDALNKSINQLKNKNNLKVSDSCQINKINYDNLIVGKYKNNLLLCVEKSKPKSSRNISDFSEIYKIKDICLFKCKNINIIPLN